MHALNDYLCRQLEDRVRKHRIVVFYDPRREFAPFFDDELQEISTTHEGLSRYWIGDKETFVVGCDGSYFGLRAKIEPIVCQDTPAPIIIYVPGEEPERAESVLLEMELAGTRYDPKLKQAARHLLSKSLSDGRIDEILANEALGYRDVVAVLQQSSDGEKASLLKAVLGDKSSEEILAEWVRDASRDTDLAEKGAQPELLQLLQSRIGWADADGQDLAQWRSRVVRYLLVNEFRSDLGCEPPASIAKVPEHRKKEHLERIRAINQRLRRDYSDVYEQLADLVEQELHLSGRDVDASSLGSIDTFRFEEPALLAVAGERVLAKDWAAAMAIVEARNRSFWLDRDITRQAQWQACRYVAELGNAVDEVEPEVDRSDRDPSKWVEAYCEDGGWHRVDLLQRRLETHVANMDADPEIEQALHVVRRAHEQLIQKMAMGFADAVSKNEWSIPGVLRQPEIYPQVVEKMGGRTAYFFVDAMRYEMGVELHRQLKEGLDLAIRPAICALPSITTVGMAALLPGAAASFSVVEDRGRLASQIQDKKMPGIQQRMNLLKALVPDSFDILLGNVLKESESALSSRLESVSLVVVRSQEIDAAGENVDGLAARQAMQSVISNIARAVRKLAKCGVERFVITADHGHLFSLRKEEDMRVESPGGNQVELHRRCWIGRGGVTPPGAMRVQGRDLGYDTDLEFVFPAGSGVFRSGGGLSFHHGGVSLQEMVIPVVTLRMAAVRAGADGDHKIKLLNVPEKLTNRTFLCEVQVGEALFARGEVELRVEIWAGKDVVGKCVMATGAVVNEDKGTVLIKPGANANLGLLVSGDPGQAVEIVVLDALSDAVMAQSGKIPVKLGI